MYFYSTIPLKKIKTVKPSWRPRSLYMISLKCLPCWLGLQVTTTWSLSLSGDHVGHKVKPVKISRSRPRPDFYFSKLNFFNHFTLFAVEVRQPASNNKPLRVTICSLSLGKSMKCFWNRLVSLEVIHKERFTSNIPNLLISDVARIFLNFGAKIGLLFYTEIRRWYAVLRSIQGMNNKNFKDIFCLVG